MDITDELMIASQYEKHGGRAHLMVHASEEIARLRAENERLKTVQVSANDVIREIIEQAHMAGQISAGIDPSFSNAQQYCDKLFPPNA